eukprot:6177071-Pleurochrysis_carterae.AAC.5
MNWMVRSQQGGCTVDASRVQIALRGKILRDVKNLGVIQSMHQTRTLCEYAAPKGTAKNGCKPLHGRVARTRLGRRGLRFLTPTAIRANL